MTLIPGADGELPVGAFMGETPPESQPTGDPKRYRLEPKLP
jgi:hypothetical protein